MEIRELASLFAKDRFEQIKEALVRGCPKSERIWVEA